ncbi:50S ribosomal protein L24 [Candidatus Blochmanniella vafra str. BVAF]|uniref:Large ribosomal subunit protein uL24 n=1 Tax=Blochmanniella vafra (strain BVAF) TaxID=859654 RepID=E8Q5Y8_BLOVB|nr:50S ribosomal protein L24 [Candidatus Blochmannia vafer]ADV33604.1 50S ribosomal protein L24 [Candidatus Blochmannia vafer str. BVAF]
MAAKKIRCGDEVIMLNGKDKGKIGKVQCIFSLKNRAMISGINLMKKHKKPVPDKNQPGGIFKKEASVDLSNIAIFNPDCKKADKVVFKIKDGKKIRVFKSSGNVIK